MFNNNWFQTFHPLEVVIWSTIFIVWYGQYYHLIFLPLHCNANIPRIGSKKVLCASYISKQKWPLCTKHSIYVSILQFFEVEMNAALWSQEDYIYLECVLNWTVASFTCNKGATLLTGLSHCTYSMQMIHPGTLLVT